jgi:acyl-CoA synthetase (AMP-forming)/AMP-acid ligase II/acyl carrier protein
VIEGLESALGVPVIEAYGMTEAAHQMTSNPLPPGMRKPGSVGLPAGPEVAIADTSGQHLSAREVGEVVIRGANVTAGYHGLEDQSGHVNVDGWFRTGDQGYIDEDGYVYLTGRLKEIINRGGETIAPREVDEALLGIDGILQAVAFSVPDKILGEEVAAAVILKRGVDLAEDGIQANLSEVLTVAKIPKRIVFVDEIPKGPTGKLQRLGLAKRLGLTSVRSSAAGESPSNRAIADKVAQIWKEVLEIEIVGPNEEFLEVGGDSIGATALAAAIETEFDVDLPLMAFYSAATINQQAALVNELVQMTKDR